MKKETFINKIITFIIGEHFFSMNRTNNTPIKKRIAKTIKPDREYSYNEIAQHVFVTLKNDYQN